MTNASRRIRSPFELNSQINVTPFVDVMLVLLIVFMVAAPLLAVTVPVDLARTSAKPKADAKPLTVTVTSEGAILVQDNPTAKGDLVLVIQNLSKGETDQRIYLRGARDASYEDVIEIMGLINAAGFNRIGLMGSTTQVPD